MITPNPFERPARPFDDRPVTEPTRNNDVPDTSDRSDDAAPERHEDVIARVRELLGKYPNLGSRQLYDLAVRMHPDLEQAGFRSFHARYVLPLKREKARAEGRLPKPRAPKAVSKRPRRSRASQAEEQAPATAGMIVDVAQVRGRVREILLRLARQVAVADSRADLVDALASVEDMVDQVLQAMQPPQPESEVSPE